MFNYDYFLNDQLFCLLKRNCLMNEYLSYLYPVFVVSIAIYCYYTVTATDTEISVGSLVWNHYCYCYDGHRLTVRSVKTYCTVLLSDAPHMTVMVSK